MFISRTLIFLRHSKKYEILITVFEKKKNLNINVSASKFEVVDELLNVMNFIIPREKV